MLGKPDAVSFSGERTGKVERRILPAFFTSMLPQRNTAARSVLAAREHCRIQLSERSAAKSGNPVVELFGRVHDERTVLCQRLVQCRA